MDQLRRERSPRIAYEVVVKSAIDFLQSGVYDGHAPADCAAALHGLADDTDRRISRAVPSPGQLSGA